MTSRLVLVLGDLFIPDRAPVRKRLLKYCPPLSLGWFVSRTYRPKYALILLALLSLLIYASPVQKTPCTKQDWPNPLPGQSHRQRNLWLPPGHSPRSTDCQRWFWRRSTQPRPLQSRDTWLPSYWLHAWAHDNTAGWCGQLVDCSATYGCRRSIMGRHAQVWGVWAWGKVFRESGKCDGGAWDRVVGRGGRARAELLFDGCESRWDWFNWEGRSWQNLGAGWCPSALCISVEDRSERCGNCWRRKGLVQKAEQWFGSLTNCTPAYLSDQSSSFSLYYSFLARTVFEVSKTQTWPRLSLTNPWPRIQVCAIFFSHSCYPSSLWPGFSQRFRQTPLSRPLVLQELCRWSASVDISDRNSLAGLSAMHTFERLYQ